MTGRGGAEVALWGTAVLAMVWTVIAWPRGSLSAPEIGPVASSPPAVRGVAGGALAAAVRTVVESNPFRLDRRSAAVAFGAPAEPGEGGAVFEYAEPEPERPSPVLRGIVGGPPWEALLEGIPGREGSVLVRPGDVIGDLRVRSIGRDTVVVQGADTTWRLTLTVHWQ